MNSPKRTNVPRRVGPTTKWWIQYWVETDPKSGCWIWERYKDPHGYGRTSENNHPVLVHRLAWMLWRGEVPKGMFVCHKCDNPSCVNPNHLFLGTAKDNNADRTSKGRSMPSGVRGEQHGMSAITEEQARSIFNEPGIQRDIAKKFGITQHAVWCIKAGRTWKHIHNHPGEDI